jgi:hypothetical protein
MDLSLVPSAVSQQFLRQLAVQDAGKKRRKFSKDQENYHKCELVTLLLA